MLNKAFTKEETERLLAAPNILADFFKRAGDVGFTVAAEQIRATYWEIETHATRLRRMAKGWQTAEMGMASVGREAQLVLEKAADELDRLAKFSVRRPISELRQEAFKGRPNGPDRLVVLWGPSGYQGLPWRCAIGRWSPEGRSSGFVLYNGSRFTDGGPDATHFSELPDDEAR